MSASHWSLPRAWGKPVCIRGTHTRALTDFSSFLGDPDARPQFCKERVLRFSPWCLSAQPRAWHAVGAARFCSAPGRWSFSSTGPRQVLRGPSPSPRGPRLVLRRWAPLRCVLSPQLSPWGRGGAALEAAGQVPFLKHPLKEFAPQN